VKLWRISNYADLKGIGGLKSKGRWHNRGAPIVYFSDTPALAMLEVLVHFDLSLNEIPDNYQLLEVEYNQRKGVSRLKDAFLKPGWQSDEETTRQIGDEWLLGSSSVLLRVPSALVPHSFNYLFNPKHSLAIEAEIISASLHPYDPRFG
jgi:RES domain-containing protein